MPESSKRLDAYSGAERRDERREPEPNLTDIEQKSRSLRLNYDNSSTSKHLSAYSGAGSHEPGAKSRRTQNISITRREVKQFS